MALTCKKSLYNLQFGDYIWIKYVASSNSFGIFSDIATKTDADISTNTIPEIASATPNGYIKMIYCGKDYLGRSKLIAGQNIQHSISWDTLNTNGVASGSGRPIQVDNLTNYNFTIRLMSGGISSTDNSNEWDKIIVSSTLNNTISAGDNNVWNWNSISSWTSSTGTTNTNKIIRGNTTVGTTNAPTGLVSSNSNTTTGFRPVLLVEHLITCKYLIKQNSNYYSINLSNYDNITLHNFTPISLTGGVTPNSNDINTYGFNDLSILTTSMISGSDTFIPLDKLNSQFDIKMYKG
jgi:hypothetical protein